MSYTLIHDTQRVLAFFPTPEADPNEQPQPLPNGMQSAEFDTPREAADWVIQEELACTVTILPPVPQNVSRWQMFRAIDQALGLTRDQLRGMLTTETAKIDFDEAGGFQRDNPLIAMVGQTLGKTEADIDDLFRLAASFK